MEKREKDKRKRKGRGVEGGMKGKWRSEKISKESVLSFYRLGPGVALR